MNFEECVSRNMIKPNQNRDVNRELRTAKRFIRSAEANKKIKEWEMVEIAAYNAGFHCARALLYCKGYSERSHHCLYVAIKELFKEERIVRSAETMEEFRYVRNNVQYAGDTAFEEEAGFFLGFVKQFYEETKQIVSQKCSKT